MSQFTGVIPDWTKRFRFHVPFDLEPGHFRDVLPSQALTLVLKKLNLILQNQTRYDTMTQKFLKKQLNLGFVTLYNIQPGNVSGLLLQP